VRIPIPLALLLLVLPVGAWQAKQFPVKILRISALFGESRGDHFHSGLDFATPQAIYPCDEGEVLFASDAETNPNRPVVGIGNHVIVEHEGGFRTHYMHLQSGSIPKNLGPAKTGESLGFMGDSGYSMGAHLHLVVEDTKNGALVNPLKYLPTLEDTTRPQLAGFLAMVKGNPRPFRFRDWMTMHWRGEMTLFLFAWDLRQGFDPWKFRTVNADTGTSVKRVSLRVDDRLLREYDFSVLRKKPKGLVVDPHWSHDDIYGQKFNYRMGAFTPTEASHTFQVVVEDWSGNTLSEYFHVSFRQ